MWTPVRHIVVMQAGIKTVLACLLRRSNANVKPELAERSVFGVAESWLTLEGVKMSLFPANLACCIKRGREA